jgi:autotransporter strand-loop-strand O-heptosyltransferase
MDESNTIPDHGQADPPAAVAPPQPQVPTAAAPEAGAKPPYPPPVERPTQVGALGIRFDFNQGARVVLPDRSEGSWRVRLTDRDTGNILFQSENQGALVRSSKRWFVRFGIEVWELDAAGSASLVLAHDYDATGHEVLIQFPVGTLGDILAWFPYAARFAEVHRCRLTCALSAQFVPLLRAAYPAIAFVTHEQLIEQGLPARAYATYCIGLFFDDQEFIHQPIDFRHVGLHRTAGHILGVDPAEQRPLLAPLEEARPIAEPYVCIAVQSSTQSKKWNNPYGWLEVIAFLKAAGYRVICIDRETVHGAGLAWTQIPNGAEDETGDRPLTERAHWLRHAAAFVGLSSGLSWLAWAAGTPVVLISGFTLPDNEFATPYRVINWHACTGCWNDVRLRFDHKDFLWCPRHAGTPRQFECTRLITATQVIAALRRIPGLIEPAGHASPPIDRKPRRGTR